MNQIEAIIAYEQGELSVRECIKLFQELLDSGLIWELQGHYQRVAKNLLEQGCIIQK